jgi:hypothetical protein
LSALGGAVIGSMATAHRTPSTWPKPFSAREVGADVHLDVSKPTVGPHFNRAPVCGLDPVAASAIDDAHMAVAIVQRGSCNRQAVAEVGRSAADAPLCRRDELLVDG